MAGRKTSAPYSRRGKKVSQSETIIGYIISSEKIFDDDDWDSDGDDEFEMTSHAIRRVPIRKSRVMIQRLDHNDRNSGAAVYVTGKFPIVGDYWRIIVDVKNIHGMKYSVGMPCYRLRSDLASKRGTFKEIISDALREYQNAGVGGSEVRALMSYIDRLLVSDYTKFYRLAEIEALIDRCANEQHNEAEKTIVSNLKTYIRQSFQLKLLTIATDFPLVLQVLPLLHEKMFFSILKHGFDLKGFFNNLNQMISGFPWKLAFHWCITHELGCSIREVTCDSYKKACMWDDMEQPYKDAVMMYNVLKEHCRDTGDTFMSTNRLNGLTPRYKGYTVECFETAIKLMVKVQAIVVEDSRIYPKRLYDSEKLIASTLTKLLTSKSNKRYDLDFTDESLSILASDPDQKRAAELIATKPVVVLSGKGGCGKTEVVARVCQVILKQIYSEDLKEYNQFIDRLLKKHIHRNSNSMIAAPMNSHTMDTLASKREDSTVSVNVASNGGNEVSSAAHSCDNQNKHFLDSRQTEGETFNDSSFDPSVILSDDEDNNITSSSGFTKVKKTESLQDISYISAPEDKCFYSECSSSSYTELDDDESGPSIPDETFRKYILMTAPTGKAAKVIGKRAGFTGFTLHQIIFNYLDWRTSEREFNYKDVRLLVVDECSLVSVKTMSFLLYIMTQHTKLEKIIYLGDVLQLPSIEPGNFLIDVYGGLDAVGASVSLKRNHRSEGSLIVENAIRISSRVMPRFSTAERFNEILLKDTDHADLERDDAVKCLISTPEFACDRTSQFVAFRRTDCEAINNICSKLYTGKLCNDPTTKRMLFYEGFKICCTKNGSVNVTVVHDPHNQAADRTVNDTPTEAPPVANSNEQSQSQDAVTKKIENYIRQMTRDSSLESADDLSQQVEEKVEEGIKEASKVLRNKKSPRSCLMRLCNGEIFWIKSIFTAQDTEKGKKVQKEKWIIEDEDGLTLAVFRNVLQKACRVKPCWCRTIHTYQGSEIKHLAYFVGAPGRQNWQHVYTAVTRGKSSVTVLYNDHCLRTAVATPNHRRFCSLDENLKDKLGVPFTKCEPDTEPRLITASSLGDHRFVTAKYALQERVTLSDEMWEDNSLNKDAVKRRKTESKEFNQFDNFKKNFADSLKSIRTVSLGHGDAMFSSDSDEEALILASHEFDKIKN